MKTQFKLNYLAVLALLLTTFGCSSDDDAVAEIVVQDFSITIDENAINDFSIGTVETDSDGTLNFSITSQTPSGALSINAATGELTVANMAVFDFETNPVITATIAVAGTENTGTVTINLNNLEEISAEDVTVTLDENPTNGQSIDTVDVDGEGTLTYTISSQTPAGAVGIDESTGELTVVDAALFDFETNPVITATISVNNAATTVTTTVTINLNDLDEITVQDLTVAVDENPTDGQVVGTVQVTGGGTLDFSITSQNPAGALSIDATTGELSVVDPNLFDFETNPVITAAISVDNAVNVATAAVTINLNDVDEILVQNTNLDIDENPTSGDVVGSLVVTSGANLTYTITFQNPAGAFDINQSTGELSVDDETLFDFETNPNMLATILVDNGIQSVSANAMVALNDLNEIGEFKYGGVIFWIDPASNSEGLVCDVNDLSGTMVKWNNGTSFITGATATAIGSGQANTSTIINAQGIGTYAASLCDNLALNGYSDWFLPSRDELEEVLNKKSIIDVTAAANSGTSIGTDYYWSSTETSSGTAALFLVSNGNVMLANGNKGVSLFYVRAVRSFTDF